MGEGRKIPEWSYHIKTRITTDGGAAVLFMTQGRRAGLSAAQRTDIVEPLEVICPRFVLAAENKQVSKILLLRWAGRSLSESSGRGYLAQLSKHRSVVYRAYRTLSGR